MSVDFQMYGTKQLTSRDLALSGDPRESVEAQEELRQLGIFYYRDNRSLDGTGVIIDEQPKNVKAWYYQGVMDDDLWEMDEWSDPTIGYVKKNGDELAWVVFGRQVTVIEMQPSRLKIQWAGTPTSVR